MEAHLQQQLLARDLNVYVTFRGNWCPWCRAYLTDLNGDFLAKLRFARQPPRPQPPGLKSTQHSPLCGADAEQPMGHSLP